MDEETLYALKSTNRLWFHFMLENSFDLMFSNDAGNPVGLANMGIQQRGIKEFTYGKRNLINRLFPEMNQSINLLIRAPLDYFLWGYIKELVYSNKSAT